MPRRRARTVVVVLGACVLAVGGTGIASANAEHVLAAAAATPQQAVDTGAVEASDAQGVRTFVSVIDRRTGTVIAETDNAGEQVASESVVKILLATHYLIRYDGRLPADVSDDLAEMIKYSDDDMCSAYWEDGAVAEVAARYHLENTTVNPDNPGRWGATRITAHDMASFLYQASKDPEVGPWLLPAMRATADSGLDGYDQNFGFNALDGAASKQGWGSDNFSDQANAVHSVGVTDRYAAAVLQTGPSGTYRTMGELATNTVNLLMAATPPDVGRTDPQPPSTGKTAALRGGAALWEQAISF